MSSKSLEEIYVKLWRFDIVHVLIELLREDFSLVEGQWHTAAQLTTLLSTICSFIKPQRHSTKPTTTNKSNDLSLESFTDEELEEYYEILLPTAIDSLLIVANNIHDHDSAEMRSPHGSTVPFQMLDHFNLTLSSLSRVCCVHSHCISRVIQSPYLLHLLVTDHKLYAVHVLNTLQELASQEKDVSPTEELQSLLDELVFKIGGTDKSLAMSSLSLLALFSSSNGAILDLVCDRYNGLSILLEKWSDSFDETLTNFAQTLLERVRVSDEDYRQAKAAVIIQAGWKGYCVRRKLHRAKQGIIKFQRLYRMKKTKRIKENVSKSSNQSAKMLDAIHKIQSARERHEQQKEILEQMSANSVELFLSKQEKTAAIKIQSWWRCHSRRKELESIKSKLDREKSATTIQKAYRRHLKKKKDGRDENHLQQSFGHLHDSLLTLSPTSRCSLPPLTVTEKEQLESEIPFLGIAEAGDDFDEKEFHSLLDWFYSSREEAREADRRQAFLLTQVSISFVCIVLFMCNCSCFSCIS